jgi:hypothetical protein
MRHDGNRCQLIARTHGTDALRRTIDSGKTFQAMPDADESVGTPSAHEFVAGLGTDLTDAEAIKTPTAAEHQERILSGNALATTGDDTDAVAPATAFLTCASVSFSCTPPPCGR